MSAQSNHRITFAAAALLGLALSTAGCAGDDGSPGANGADGRNGTNGTNGTNGNDGLSCTITGTSTGTKTITCEDGTVATVNDGMNGQDGTSCTVTDNGNGTKTIACTDGTTVTINDGEPGRNGGNVEVPNFHGTGYLLSSGEFETAGKFFVKAEITSATADAAGAVSVSFTVKDEEDNPVKGIAAISANIVKLLPPANGDASSRWVSYLYRTETVSGSANGDWPNPDGTTRSQAYRENNGTLTDHGDGSYTYAFSTNISNVTVGGNAIAYERNRTHRVSIMMGGHAGPTGTAAFDFVPDGSAVTLTRNIVKTETCKGCHGGEFHGHGGDRVIVENCVTCHNPGNEDANGGETIDFKVMIHKIHAGGELASIPGPDGLVWDDPATATDESADNGSYATWGNRNSKNEWWKVEFPAVIENCTKCHQGVGAEVDNWKSNPSRAACGSCHDQTSFEVGTTSHAGGAQADDSNCSTCHPASGSIGQIQHPVPAAHDWTQHDVRNIPEFEVEMRVSTPANGTHFVAGEAPRVTLILKENGVPIDHNTVVEDATAEGCTTDPCPARDGAFRTASLFVHGPRAKRNPVLTSIARARVVAPTPGPYDLTTATGGSLGFVIDGGRNLITYDSSGGDVTVLGTFTVPLSSGTFASLSAVTAQELITWLNANLSFRRRAIAYVDEATGRLAIRSRNLGTFYSVQLQAGPVTNVVFGGDVTVHPIGSSTPVNNVAKRTNPANNDPKVTWTSTAIFYQLDRVDDLAPGTYAAGVEIADRGRIDGNNYKTPSVGRVTFQVKQAAEEKPPAGACDGCHQGPDGRGFILDFSRHNKKFDANAVDMCGQCHDYQSQSPTGGWGGARPITRRVHAVHFGSSLKYPLATVGYANGDPVKGRNWDITFPQDVRNCQACHPDGTTSGTWSTKPARLPCGGCHDADAATAHMSLMTYDPTPADPFSGDEAESCGTCH